MMLTAGYRSCITASDPQQQLYQTLLMQKSLLKSVCGAKFFMDAEYLEKVKIYLQQGMPNFDTDICLVW